MLVTLDEIERAREVISGEIHRTPTLGSTYLAKKSGAARVILKLEMFQKTGAYKVRGAFNKLHTLSDDERSRGVIGLSSGNHAQALAYAAGRAGIPATVVMPNWSTESKIEATRGYGAEIVLTDRDLLEVFHEVQVERDLIMVHPFDDPAIIAGAGTVGLEIMEDVPDADLVMTGIGGGGLISGVATAVKSISDRARVIGAEPEEAPTMTESLRLGKPARLASVDTIADGLAAPFGGEHTLAHAQEYVDDVTLVSDDEIIEAIGVILERCKVIAEPAAASTVAALMSGRIDVSGKTVVCVLSGGNIDRRRLIELLTR